MIGERFKEVRTDYGHSQLYVASNMYITQAHLSKIESGRAKPSRRLVQIFSQQYSLNEEWLLTGNGAKYVKDFIVKSLDIDATSQTSTGYILKYIMLAECLANSCNLDKVFHDLLSNENKLQILNYIVMRIVALNNDYEKEIDFSHEFEKAFPEFREYRIKFYYELNDQANKNLNELRQLPIWQDADALKEYTRDTLNSKEQCMQLENNLLSHRIYNLISIDDLSK